MTTSSQDRTLRVLHLAAGNLYGGIETFLVTLARLRRLRPNLESQFAVCFDGRLKAELDATGATVHNLGRVRVSRPWTMWRARRCLGGILEATPFDVVLSHGCWVHAFLGPAARSHEVCQVFWAHGLHDGRHWLERWARCNRPAMVLANSQLTGSAVRSLFGQAPVEVLYLPVPAPDVNDAQAVRHKIRADLQASAGTIVLLQASRMECCKGHDLLVRVLGRLRERTDWVCWIAGAAQRPAEKAYLQQLQSMAIDLGLASRIRFLGHRSDVPQLLAAADVYCQFNTAPESFGLSFVEALHAGRPVVTTALGGAVEIVNESCGFLAPVGDVNGLASSLEQLMQWPALRQRLGAAGPARARALCDPARQLERLEQLLTCLARPASAA
jgi:glycosyltransferase involved in cell wall biosynthesis